MAITLKDIAEKVGVSPTTVSLVLNQKDDNRISDATKHKIMEAVKELGYQPTKVTPNIVQNVPPTNGSRDGSSLVVHGDASGELPATRRAAVAADHVPPRGPGEDGLCRPHVPDAGGPDRLRVPRADGLSHVRVLPSDRQRRR